MNSGHKVYISPSEHVRIMRCMSDVVKHSLVLVVVNSYWSEACVILCTCVHVMFSIGCVTVFSIIMSARYSGVKVSLVFA